MDVPAFAVVGWRVCVYLLWHLIHELSVIQGDERARA